ncbi:MAG TPA: hypothetical protein VIM02_10180, partial [Rhizomicrobium sp.]
MLRTSGRKKGSSPIVQSAEPLADCFRSRKNISSRQRPINKSLGRRRQQNSVRQSCGDVADSNAAIAAAQELEIRKPFLPQLDEIACAQACKIRGRVELEDKIFAGLIACLPVRVDDKEGVARE